jgi:hypothetical protein
MEDFRMTDSHTPQSRSVGPIAVETAAALFNAVLSNVQEPNYTPPTVYFIAQLIANYTNADGLVKALREIAAAGDPAHIHTLANEALATVEARELPRSH